MPSSIPSSIGVSRAFLWRNSLKNVRSIGVVGKGLHERFTGPFNELEELVVLGVGDGIALRVHDVALHLPVLASEEPD